MLVEEGQIVYVQDSDMDVFIIYVAFSLEDPPQLNSTEQEI